MGYATTSATESLCNGAGDANSTPGVLLIVCANAEIFSLLPTASPVMTKKSGPLKPAPKPSLIKSYALRTSVVSG